MTKATKRTAMLVRGKKNLAAMKRAANNPKMSEAGKKTLAEMVLRQAAINSALEKALTSKLSKP